LDEPSVGLASAIAPRALELAAARAHAAGNCGLAIEHNYRAVMGMADRLCIMKAGRIVYDGATDIVDRPAEFRNFYL
jgi:ABC-type branched-subunit amino acid transport system ATPase component